MKWLATFPSTNALVATGILLALATGVRVLASPWVPPDGWLLFVAGFASVGAAQFTSKRLTHKEPASAP